MPRLARNILLAGAMSVATAIDIAPAHSAGHPAPLGSTPIGHTERSYRIVGKLHLALFTVGSDDVGSARISWRSDEQGVAVSLLVGSDPEHAPKRLNEWGYVREEVGPSGAEVFVLRRAADDEQRARPTPTPREDRLFAAGCASMSESDVRSYATIVDAPGATYRTFDRLLLQLVDAHPKWDERHLARPSGAQPGFLMALQALLRAIGTSVDDHGVAPVAYVYNNKVYDLSVRRLRALGRTTVASRTFDTLTRGDLTVRNRSTGEQTKFAVTFVPDAQHVCLPVQIFYQPNFWVSVELRQDDLADAPADPAGDGGVLVHIKHICAAAAH